MNIITSHLYLRYIHTNLTFARWKFVGKRLSTAAYKVSRQETEVLTPEEKLFKKYENSIIYSDFKDIYRFKLSFRHKLPHNKAKQPQLSHSLPVALKYFGYDLKKDEKSKTSSLSPTEDAAENVVVHFPFQDVTTSVIINETLTKSDENHLQSPDIADETNREIRMRLELLNKSPEHLNWMHDYENYVIHETHETITESETTINYGTPDREIPSSKVPCGGCGALLHCRDAGIPGYIPSEIFTSHSSRGGIRLEGIHCQRCHFLENYNMALQVRVSSEDYPKVLSSISLRENALVLLLVDLLDFPCSIWPGIADLIGQGRPIVVVGNKVDLLPDDGKGYLHRVRDNLRSSIREAGLGMTNIQHVALISAKTGFGVEDLITRLQALWQYQGDVYIVGCTNVGKSSLFNLLLQSDFCKHTAADLIQRATTSPWPGTTLNLLKFPLMRPFGWKLYVRHKRLRSMKHLESQERELRHKLYKDTKHPKYATLVGHIERSMRTEEPVDPLDEHSINFYELKGSAHSKGGSQVGLDPKDKRFVCSKWCYDTPGVVQPEQILNHFTTDELVKVLPNNIINPRTFSLSPGSSLFIAGIARMDYLEGEFTCRFTVFASSQLPITICKSEEADAIYEDLLRSKVFVVPINDEERLKVWPALEASKYFTVTGIDRNTSAGDLVLSNAGWIAITPNTAERCIIQGWTPERRGIYLRDCLLPNIVRKRGTKLRGSCIYRFYK